jgi:hypothetical protein
MKLLYTLFALSGIFYVTNNLALSYVSALFALLVFFRNREYFTVESIQDNTVPHVSEDKKDSNKVREYVPYTISPYLEVPYKNKTIKGNDPARISHLNIDKIYPKSDMNPFKNNKAYPEACTEGNAMFSTDMGCIKLTPEQIRFVSSRGHNMDPYSSYL